MNNDEEKLAAANNINPPIDLRATEYLVGYMPTVGGWIAKEDNRRSDGIYAKLVNNSFWALFLGNNVWDKEKKQFVFLPLPSGRAENYWQHKKFDWPEQAHGHWNQVIRPMFISQAKGVWYGPDEKVVFDD